MLLTDWQAVRQECAIRHAVSPAIHHDDMLWQFVLKHPAFPASEDAVRYYFSDGAESARKLADIIARNLARRSAARYSLLEFASGYGMVTRHLGTLLESASVVSCDIHDEAVAFIRDELNQDAVISRHIPEELTFDAPFDVVFALSFFSHMPEATFGRWLKALFGAVREGGMLVFTTHGLASRQNFGDIEIPDSGFWFMANSEQGDLDGAEYGSSVTTPEYVIGELFRTVGAPIREFRQGYWWGHQDLYVVPKPGDRGSLPVAARNGSAVPTPPAPGAAQNEP